MFDRPSLHPVPNVVKAAAADGRRIKGIHLTFPSVPIIEVLAGSDIDYVYLDGEHGPFDGAELEACCLAAERHGLTTIARVPSTDQATIGFYLDRGVEGIIVPHIETPEDVRQIVRYVYHAPLGERSLGSGRPHHGLYATGDRITEINANTSFCVMIESAEGVRRAGELAAVPGVDYMSFGMNDLAQSMGFAGQPDHPEVLEARRQASEAIRAAGKRVREDFMTYAWIANVLLAGMKQLTE